MKKAGTVIGKGPKESLSRKTFFDVWIVKNIKTVIKGDKIVLPNPKVGQKSKNKEQSKKEGMR